MPKAIAPLPHLAEFLAETPLCQGLPPEQMAAISALVHCQQYDKGEVLFLQGAPGAGFYLIYSGRVKVFQLSAQGREQILHIFESGEHFAEVPALDGQPFPASAAAIDRTTALFFPRQPLLDLLTQNPALTVNLLKSFARHLRRFSRLVDDLSLREVPGRLAAYLLSLSDRQPATAPADNIAVEIVELDLTKWQLAARLGTIPETLSRVLYRLSQDGIIAVEGNQIELRDRRALQAMAQ